MDGGERGDEGLLEDHADGVHRGGDQAQHHAEDVARGLAAGGRQADHRDAGERERQPGGEPDG
ncbi:hypothetical protein [Nocardioides convexus]|uniref:hypothetical protein n=1 Tax=Nocardioides convexus TaxID=2712224 RepID=UPI002418300B|nr:hypothetical protein [Nocardioides convexus]